MPFLIGRSAAEAVAMLEALGLEADVERGLPFGLDGGDRVISQSHGAGSLVDPGTTVTVRTL